MIRRRGLHCIVLAVTLASLAGCADATRVVTLNQTTQVPGARAEAAVQRQLANEGLPSARVSCAKTLIVDVGAIHSCSVSGLTRADVVHFTFSDASGRVYRVSLSG